MDTQHELTDSEVVRAAKIGIAHELDLVKTAQTGLMVRVHKLLPLLTKVRQDANNARQLFYAAHRKACAESGRKHIILVRSLGIKPPSFWGDGFSDKPNGWPLEECIRRGAELPKLIETYIERRTEAHEQLASLRAFTKQWKGYTP